MHRAPTLPAAAALALIVSCLAAPLTSAPALAADLYGVMGDSSLVLFNRTTGDAVFLHKLAYAPRSLAYDASLGRHYGVVATPEVVLVRIDPLSGSSTVVGPLFLPGPDSVRTAEALAFHPADGLLYASVSLNTVDTRSEKLATIDPATGVVTVIGAFDGTLADDGDALQFVGETLYSIDDPGSGPSRLYRIDWQTAPGLATELGTLGSPRVNNVNDLAYVAEDATLYGYDPGARELVTIDPLAGQATVIGTTHLAGEFSGSLLACLSEGPTHPLSGVVPAGPGASARVRVSPNPSTGHVRFELTSALGPAPEDGLTLDVMDLAGRVIAGPWRVPPGARERVWDGRNASGDACAPGTYFVRVRSGESVATRAFVLRR